MGVLELETVVWPSSASYSGADFDILARKHLFAAGLSYGHGTGHGIGSCLCVHEGPIGVSSTAKPCYMKFENGMCVSNEPGYYHAGEFGIRIENVMMVVPHPKLTDCYKFENLTFAPYCRNLIDTNILGPKFTTYVNNFHQ